MLFEKDFFMVGGLKFIHIDKNNLDSFNHFYRLVRVNKITANATQGLLLFGMNNYWCEYNGYLVICHIYRNVISLVTFPFNEHGYMPINEIVKFMKDNKIVRVRWVLDTYFKNDDITLVSEYFLINRLYTEYVVDMNLLALLDGREYKNIRKDCSRLKKKHGNIIYRCCTQNDRTLIKLVYNIWCKKSGIKYRNVYDRVYLFNMFEIDPSKFLLFFDNDKPIGFVNYYEINARSVYCGFLKFDKEYYGLPRFMEYERAKYLCDLGYKYMNIDADDNSQGLADFKNSLRPTYRMVEYELHLK